MEVLDRYFGITAKGSSAATRSRDYEVARAAFLIYFAIDPIERLLGVS